VAHHQIFQKRQLSVKEVPAPGTTVTGSDLGARPVHHVGQRHGVVLLAMQHQRAVMGVGGSGATSKRLAAVPTSTDFAPPRGAPQCLHRMAGDDRAKRKTGQRQRPCGRNCLHHRQHVVHLATPLVVDAGAGARRPGS
jgi:hypothetical protein